MRTVETFRDDNREPWLPACCCTPKWGRRASRLQTRRLGRISAPNRLLDTYKGSQYVSQTQCRHTIVPNASRFPVGGHQRRQLTKSAFESLCMRVLLTAISCHQHCPMSALPVQATQNGRTWGIPLGGDSVGHPGVGEQLGACSAFRAGNVRRVSQGRRDSTHTAKLVCRGPT